MSQDNPATAYRADSPYIYAYFRQQHPPLIYWTALLAGIAPPSDATRRLAHCELGFGQGLGLAITAASLSDQQVGVDFMPEQVAQLSGLLHDADIHNAQLHATDFAGFLAHNTQRFQTISLHGVWSWVAPEIRQQLIQIIDRFLDDDGFVYISHNVLPGRAPLLPMQRLIHHTAQQLASEQDNGLMPALSVLNSMMPLSRYAQSTPDIQAWWQSLAGEHPDYLAHEYLGQAWHPMLFADTAQALAQAGLSFACSADASELLSDIHLSTEQQAWLAHIPDIALRQSYSDMLRNVGFRRDIWAKSVQPLSVEEQQTRLLATRLVLLHPMGALPLEITGDLGVFSLPEAPIKRLLDALAADDYRPKTAKDVLSSLHETQPDLRLVDFIQLLTSLTAIGYLHPAQSDEDIERNTASAQVLNRQLCQRAWQDGSIGYLASPVAGCGLQVSRLQQLLLLAQANSRSNNPVHWANWLMAQRWQAQTPFLPEISAEEQGAWLITAAQAFAQARLPLLYAHRVL